MTSTKIAGKKGGLARKANHDKTRLGYIEYLRGLTTHQELIEILDSKPRRSNEWLETKIRELTKK